MPDPTDTPEIVIYALSSRDAASINHDRHRAQLRDGTPSVGRVQTLELYPAEIITRYGEEAVLLVRLEDGGTHRPRPSRHSAALLPGTWSHPGELMNFDSNQRKTMKDNPLHTAFESTLSILKTVGQYALNKLFPILILVGAYHWYLTVPLDGAKPVPFMEVYYALILLLFCIVVAPLVRLLVFPEAAEFAEKGGLTKTLSEGAFTPATLHYWIATLISYITTWICIGTIIK